MFIDWKTLGTPVVSHKPTPHVTDMETARDLLCVVREVTIVNSWYAYKYYEGNYCKKASYIVLFFRSSGVILKMLNWLMMARD